MSVDTSPIAEPHPIVEVKDLKVHFPSLDGTQTVKAVDGVDFSIMPGKTFGIIGESGSGKTTIGRVLSGLLDPTTGSILYEGENLARLPKRRYRHVRRRYQIIFQDPNAALNPRMRILDSLIEPMVIRGGLSKDDMRARALDSIERVGLRQEVAFRYPHQLSGGQKQRVNIARILPLEPRLVVCDEVVAALDASMRGEVLNLFHELQQDLGLAYAFIAHDISSVAHVSDSVAVTYLGRFAEMGPTDDVIHRPRHPYTAALLSTEPVALPASLRTSRRIELKGEIPSPVAPPSGCRFRTRCPFAEERCAQEVPDWRQVDPDHYVACHFAGNGAFDAALRDARKPTMTNQKGEKICFFQEKTGRPSPDCNPI